MGGTKTFFAALMVAASISGPATADEDGLLRTIATCAGRLSAEMEHQWLTGGAKADLAETRREATVDVLEAMTPKGRERDIMAWRIDAKVAQASLLSRATFNDDADDAQWARRMAETTLAACHSLVLS